MLVTFRVTGTKGSKMQGLNQFCLFSWGFCSEITIVFNLFILGRGSLERKFTIRKMKYLSVHLHLEILSYVTLADRLEYARVNHLYCRELLIGVRKITLEPHNGLEHFLTSQTLRRSVLKVIENSFHQLGLNLILKNSSFEIPDIQGDWKISLRSLQIKVHDFCRLRPIINQVQQLILFPHEDEDQRENVGEENIGTHSSFDELLNELCKLPGLRELSFKHFSHLRIPTVSQLLKLELQECSQFNVLSILHLKNLRFLKLHSCAEITDVSCLDHIYELHLIDCSSIFDISGLNHNAIIYIDSCPIRHCFQSFQYSKRVTLNRYRGQRVNLDRLQAIQSLTISCDNYNYFCSLPMYFTKGFPPSLRYLALQNVTDPFALPNSHRLRNLTIECCHGFALKNLEGISVVKIINCSDIRDWSPLNNISTVEISSCSSFRSTEQLNNVKELILRGNSISNMLDLRYITRLQLFSSPSDLASSFTSNNLLPTAIHLKEIQFSVWNHYLNSDEKKFLISLKNYYLIKRIVIHHANGDPLNLGKDLENLQDLLTVFDIEWLKLSFQTIF